jgi:hypothetical protein
MPDRAEPKPKRKVPAEELKRRPDESFWEHLLRLDRLVGVKEVVFPVPPHLRPN